MKTASESQRIQGHNGGVYDLLDLVPNGDAGLFGMVRKASVVTTSPCMGPTTRAGDRVAIKELRESEHTTLKLGLTSKSSLEEGILIRKGTRKLVIGEELTLDHVDVIRPRGSSFSVGAVSIDGSVRELQLKEYKALFCTNEGASTEDAPSKWTEFVKRLERLHKERRMMEEAPDHPNLLPLLDWAEEIDGNEIRVFLVMPLCDGDLLDHLSMEKPGDAMARRYFADISSAVLALHRAEIVHRDIKCDNIFVDRDENGAVRLRLGDFGAATKIHRSEDGSPRRLFARVGSHMTMAPEVITQSETDEPDVDPEADDGYCGERADAWSLGVILFQLLMQTDFWLKTTFGWAKMQIAATSDSGFKALVNKTGRLPEKIPAGARPVILQLLNVEANKRLTIEAALNQPWVAGRE